MDNRIKYNTEVIKPLEEEAQEIKDQNNVMIEAMARNNEM